jgi:hypothetical protein
VRIRGREFAAQSKNSGKPATRARD